jgi:hypothetical protein
MTMHRKNVEIYAEQDDSMTRVVAQIDGDKPVILFQYDRNIAEAAGSIAMIAVRGEGTPHAGADYLGVEIRFIRNPEREQAALVGA